MPLKPWVTCATRAVEDYTTAASTLDHSSAKRQSRPVRGLANCYSAWVYFMDHAARRVFKGVRMRRECGCKVNQEPDCCGHRTSGRRAMRARGGRKKGCESEEDAAAESIKSQIVAAIVPQAAVPCGWGKDEARTRQGCHKDAARMRQGRGKDAASPPRACHKPTPSQTHPQNRHTTMRKQPHNNCRAVQVAAIVPQAAVPCGRIHAATLSESCPWVPRSFLARRVPAVAARSRQCRRFFGLFFLGSFLARKRFFLGSVARPKFRYGAFLTLSRFRWRKLPIFTKKCRKS